jgi:hypothetical protein
MSRHSIGNVPRYFEPHVNDCFLNVLSSLLLYQKIDPHLVLADYLSFIYQPVDGYIGNNTFIKPNDIIFLAEEWFNTQFELLYLRKPQYFPGKSPQDSTSMAPGKINIMFYIANDYPPAYSRLKELIDKDIPVILAVDLYHMAYHRAFGKEHGLHYVVATGYNEDEGYFELFDKYKLSSSDFDGKLPFEDIRAARSSENPLNNPLMGEFRRPIQYLWAEVSTGRDFQITRDDILAVFRDSIRRMKGQTNINGNPCGLEVMDCFIRDLLAKKNETLDESNQYRFKTYYNEAFKVISRSRKRFHMFLKKSTGLLPEYDPGMFKCLEDSFLAWDIAANLCYKLAISQNLDVLNSIEKQLYTMRNAEAEFVARLEQYVIQNGNSTDMCRW